jgi:hypothetical protein
MGRKIVKLYTFYILCPASSHKETGFLGWYRDLREETVSLTQQQLLSSPNCQGNDYGKGWTQYGVSVL